MSSRTGRLCSTVFCLLLAPLAVTACGSSDVITEPGGGGGVGRTASVEPSSASLVVGETVQLRFTGESGRGPVPQSWASSDPGIARVSASGLVTAVSDGLAIITISGVGGHGSAAIRVRSQ